MARNRRKSEHKQMRKPDATKPQRHASADAQHDSMERDSRTRSALGRLTHGWRRVLVLASIISAALTLLGHALNIDQAISRWTSHKSPTVQIKYFKKQGSNYDFIEPENVVLLPSQRELTRNYVAVPINLAVRNLEESRLEATRVEITYPKGLRVTPQGRPKIDPQNNTLIYEHELRSLDPVESFTPLDTIDVIYMEHSIKGLRNTLLIHDNTSRVVSSAAIEVMGPPYAVDLKVRLFSRNRPPLEAKLHISVDASQAFDSPKESEDSLVPALLTNSDAALFRAVSKRLVTAKRVWEVKVRGKSMTFALAKTRYRQGFYNGLLLGGKVTEIHVDSDGDGMLDYVLGDTTNPRSPDQKWVPSQPEPLTDEQRPDEVQLA
jgi:hypothetical protein